MLYNLVADSFHTHTQTL